MKELPKIFLDLAAIYHEHGFCLYMIGGTSRDFLLGLDPDDLDFVTDATPDQERAFLEKADYTFARFGSVKVTFEGEKIDVTTLREEGAYADFRHPSQITFIKDLRTDSLRRDFTVNALYIDAKGQVFDFHNGLKDLENKVLRFIGDPYKRIHEDPLRILRAERFAARLKLNIDPVSQKAMEELHGELERLNPQKVLMEKKKV